MILSSTKLLGPFQPQETNYQCENYLPSTTIETKRSKLMYESTKK